MLRQQTAVKDVVSPTRARSNSPLETTIQLSAEQKTQHQEKIDAEGSTKVEKQERLLKAQTALAEARAQEGGSGGAKQSRTACERLSTAIDDTAGALGVQSGLGGVKTVSHGSVLGDAQFEEKDEEERSRTVSFSLRAASTRSLSFSGGYLRDECPDNGEGLDGGEGKRRAGCTMWYYSRRWHASNVGYSFHFLCRHRHTLLLFRALRATSTQHTSRARGRHFIFDSIPRHFDLRFNPSHVVIGASLSYLSLIFRTLMCYTKHFSHSDHLSCARQICECLLSLPHSQDIPAIAHQQPRLPQQARVHA